MKGWGLQRYATLLLVLAVHLGVFALLLMTPMTRGEPRSPLQSVELLLLTPADVPPIRVANLRPRRLSAATDLAITPPLLDSTSPSAPASPSDGPQSAARGNGSAVDWAAEAHRALQAFEIRNHQPKNDVLVTGSPAEEHWWPYTKHQPGDHFKTPSGDWIVWINSSCYQVANSGPNTYALGMAPPRTFCIDESNRQQSGSPDGPRVPQQ
jgi:hypothetical protein